METKDEQKSRIAKKLAEKIGRPAANAKEKRLRAAAKDQLAGEGIAEIERMYAINQTELNRFFKRIFPTDTDRFQFLEECMVTNAAIAMQVFTEKHKEMTAIEAAKAATLFAEKAVVIKKAREAGFKEPPINVAAILRLEKTLNVIAEQHVHAA